MLKATIICYIAVLNNMKTGDYFMILLFKRELAITSELSFIISVVSYDLFCSLITATTG